MYKRLLLPIVCFFSIVMLNAQDINGSYDYDGTTRNYILHIPTTYDAQTPTPLVLALHGLGDMISNFSNVGLSALSDTENFIVVYPQALDSPLGAAWNNGASSFGITLNATVDDVGFLSSLIDTIATSYTVDMTRVYSTGFSMGSIMTHRLACELNHRLAAVAGVAGPMSDVVAADCNLERPIPVMHMHGTEDATLNYDDGSFNGIGAGLMGAEEAITFWVDKNGCPTDPVITSLPDSANDGYTVETQQYSTCNDDTEVLLYKIYNGPHTWLQGNNDVDANVEIWEFFKKYQLDELPTSLPTIANKKKQLLLFPNPVAQELTIKLDDAKAEWISIYNATGQLVKTIAVTNELLTLDVTQLPTGFYTASVITTTQERISQSFVKE